MNATFPRLLTLLRKERGISQKEAAISLKVSQALLSHYEKGIRECGLEFVVRAADFYDVSCDYLLGRTADKSGAMIAVDDIPDSESAENGKGSVLPVLNKKLILNSITILFDVLQRVDNKDLTTEISAYLDIAVYTAFRQLYFADTKNPPTMFAVPEHLFTATANGSMGVAAARMAQLTKGIGGKLPPMAPDALSKTYPLFASSLFNLIKNAETRLAKS